MFKRMLKETIPNVHLLIVAKQLEGFIGLVNLLTNE
jgi:hypothetical protein